MAEYPDAKVAKNIERIARRVLSQGQGADSERPALAGSAAPRGGADLLRDPRDRARRERRGGAARLPHLKEIYASQSSRRRRRLYRRAGASADPPRALPNCGPTDKRSSRLERRRLYDHALPARGLGARRARRGGLRQTTPRRLARTRRAPADDRPGVARSRSSNAGRRPVKRRAGLACKIRGGARHRDRRHSRTATEES
jgi:hypothetical protein